MKEIFVKVCGINHPRYVGFDKETGKCYDFDPLNAHSYRGAKNKEELNKAETEAGKYYNCCKERVRIDNFSIKYIDKNGLEFEKDLAYHDLNIEMKLEEHIND